MQRAPLGFVLLTSVLGLAACSSGYDTYPSQAAVAPAPAPAPVVVPAQPAYRPEPPVSSTGPYEQSGAPVRAPTTTPQ